MTRTLTDWMRAAGAPVTAAMRAAALGLCLTCAACEPAETPLPAPDETPAPPSDDDLGDKAERLCEDVTRSDC